uniref:B9 domain-containing protein 1 n=2 Tax=Macrostomum lignano TaxID=282301 RepID=A0A1I8HGA8_9PLAT
MAAEAGASSFMLNVCGQIESVELPHYDYIFLIYQFVHGDDWERVLGLEEGVSQLSSKSADVRGLHAFAFPVEVTFKSTNPHGWPQLVVTALGTDIWGNQVVRGYSVCHLPMQPGRVTKRVPLFAPQSSSLMSKLQGLMQSEHPLYTDPKILGQGQGRQVTRVRSLGQMTLNFSTSMKNTRALGYQLLPGENFGAAAAM